MPPRLQAFIKTHLPRVNRALNHWLPKANAKPALVHRAMRYSIDAGGKRLRPILALAAAQACGARPEKALPAACALELIHTYSLVHDDLPAMDDDDLRRGRPTSHKVFGEDIAILAGDGLLTHAFVILGQTRGASPQALIDTVRIIAERAGTFGMIGGQVADISADRGRWKKPNREFGSARHLLSYIHIHKTAALIEASLLAGARLADASAVQLKALERYGRAIGVAFQVADDVLDRIGDKQKLGKRGSDQANQKLTYPVLHGIAGSQAEARKLVRTAHAALAPFGSRAQVLHDLADFVISRDH